MSLWWNEMLTLQQVLFVIAVATTVFMLIQAIMLICGIGGDEDAFDVDAGMDADIDSINDVGAGNLAGVRVVSVRTVLVFICIGSWVTYALCYVLAWYFAAVIGAAAGIAAGIGFAYAMHAALKLQNSGNIEPNNAIGKIAEVYLTVPALRQGAGKVNVFLQERYTEFDAVTDHAQPIKTGSQVKIVGVVNEGILVCEPCIVASDSSEQK